MFFPSASLHPFNTLTEEVNDLFWIRVELVKFKFVEKEEEEEEEKEEEEERDYG